MSSSERRGKDLQSVPPADCVGSSASVLPRVFRRLGFSDSHCEGWTQEQQSCSVATIGHKFLLNGVGFLRRAPPASLSSPSVSSCASDLPVDLMFWWPPTLHSCSLARLAGPCSLRAVPQYIGRRQLRSAWQRGRLSVAQRVTEAQVSRPPRLALRPFAPHAHHLDQTVQGFRHVRERRWARRDPDVRPDLCGL